MPCEGHAILFGRTIAATVPDDLPPTLAMAVMDVAGAPALTARVVGQYVDRGGAPTVAVIGGAGKSGSLSLAAATDAGATTTVGIVPFAAESDLLDDVAARRRSWRSPTRATPWRCPTRSSRRSGAPADITVVCVDVPGCEHGAILATSPEGGTVIFFSMATSFTAAALGAEGLASDTTMLIGNGYTPGHAEYAFDLLRRSAGVRDLFTRRLAHEESRRVTTTLFRGGRVYSTADPFATALVVEDDVVAWVGHRRSRRRPRRDGVDEVVELDDAWRHAGLRRRARPHHLHRPAPHRARPRRRPIALAEALERAGGARQEGAGRRRPRARLGRDAWPEGRPPTRETRSTGPATAPSSTSRGSTCTRASRRRPCWRSPRRCRRRRTASRPDGWLSQQAHHVVRRIALDSVDPEQRRAPNGSALRARGVARASAWSTSSAARTSPVPDDFTDLLTTVGPESGLEVVGYWGEGGGPDVARLARCPGAAGDHFVDGAIGSRTAFLREPYADADTRGVAYTDAATIRDHVIACSLAGVQAGYHVIGDGAMDARRRRLRARQPPRSATTSSGLPSTGSSTSRWSTPTAREILVRPRCPGQRPAGLRRAVGRCGRACTPTVSAPTARRTLNPFASHAGGGHPTGVRVGRPCHPAGALGGGPGRRPPPPARRSG